MLVRQWPNKLAARRARELNACPVGRDACVKLPLAAMVLCLCGALSATY